MSVGAQVRPVELLEGRRPRVQIVHEYGVVVLGPDLSTISFGRGHDCEVRFGHQPLADRHIPRRAGTLVLQSDMRLAVENCSDQIAFDLKESGAPLLTVAPCTVVSPATSEFEIRYGGSHQLHTIRVAGAQAPIHSAPIRPLDTSDATIPLQPALTDRQWGVLDAYAEPMRSGALVPATHAEVAAKLGWSMSLVRLECSAIWWVFLAAGVPMRDYPDKRDAITDAATRHRLWPEPRSTDDG